MTGRAVEDVLGAALTPRTLDDAALVEALEALIALRSQLDAAWLGVVADVERRHVWRHDGFRDMAEWLAWKAGDRRGAARRDVELAERIDAMPVVADALADGTVSRAKAAELCRATGASEADQRNLVVQATTAPVDQVGRAVDRWRLEHGVAPSPPRNGVVVRATAGGVRIEGHLDAESGEVVQIALDTAATRLDVASHVPFDERRALGLRAVCRFFLDHVADPPAQRLGRPHVMVTIDLDTLDAPAGRAAALGSGAVVSGNAARRLACDAGVTRIVTDGASQPLDVGRTTRTVPVGLAKAVVHRDQHCRYQHCHAPPWACEVHHIVHWADGGPTRLDNLVLLCWHHHHLAHEHANDLPRHVYRAA